jgi:hypothetical protein
MEPSVKHVRVEFCSADGKATPIFAQTGLEAYVTLAIRN